MISTSVSYQAVETVHLQPNGSSFLPFEDDTMLSIILSKTFLLTEDSKITDPSITHQIGKGGNRTMPANTW